MANNELNYLFVTGLGRSGTTFLADLLAKIPEVTSGHERIGNREYSLLSWYLGRNYSIPFLQREKKSIDNRFSDKRLFVDVNSYLQNSTVELKEVFGTENVLHLVRDPKEVIRSVYTRRNDKDIHLLPKTQQEITEWLNADRFYQVCKNWQLAVSQIIENDIRAIQFEKLTSDYAYICNNLLEPMGLELSEDVWNLAKTTRANKTPNKPYRFLYAKLKGKQFQADELGKFETWPKSHQDVYQELCSELARKLGY